MCPTFEYGDEYHNVKKPIGSISKVLEFESRDPCGTGQWSLSL